MSGADGRPVVLVKLGGSLVTEKDRDATPRREVIARLARELAGARAAVDGAVMVGHGSGSFGHPPAERHGLKEGLRGDDALEGLALTQDRAARLHRIIVAGLRRAGLATFSVVPSSAVAARGGALGAFALEPVVLALERGLVPVTYGDVVMDRIRGATIASTETVFACLARQLPGRGWRVRRAVWLGDTEGVLDGSGEVVPEIRGDAAVSVPDAVGGSAATDVTGGMAHRLETALELAGLGVPSWIGGGAPGRLQAALSGEASSGTRVVPSSRGA